MPGERRPGRGDARGRPGCGGACAAPPPAGACSRPGPLPSASMQGGGGAADAGRPDGHCTGGPDPHVRGRPAGRRTPALRVRPAMGESGWAPVAPAGTAPSPTLVIRAQVACSDSGQVQHVLSELPGGIAGEVAWLPGLVRCPAWGPSLVAQLAPLLDLPHAPSSCLPLHIAACPLPGRRGQGARCVPVQPCAPAGGCAADAARGAARVPP